MIIDKKVKQYFVEVDKNDRVLRVCWTPLLYDLTTMGYHFLGFKGGLPKYIYDGPVMVSTG